MLGTKLSMDDLGEAFGGAFAGNVDMSVISGALKSGPDLNALTKAAGHSGLRVVSDNTARLPTSRAQKYEFT
jgi:hypothetical protein